MIGKVGVKAEFEIMNALCPPPPTENMVEIKEDGEISGEEIALS